MASASANVVGSVLSRPSQSTSVERSRRISRADMEAVAAATSAAGDGDGGGGDGGGDGEAAVRASLMNVAEDAQQRSPPPPAVRKRSTLLNLHRVIVEQEPEEPLVIILFKWLLILTGFTMLGGVAYFMGSVLYQWAERGIRDMMEADEEAAAERAMDLEDRMDP